MCVPPGFCNNGGVPATPGIDPRIVTPVCIFKFFDFFSPMFTNRVTLVPVVQSPVILKGLQADVVNALLLQPQLLMVLQLRVPIHGKLLYEILPILITLAVVYLLTITMFLQLLTRWLESKLEKQLAISILNFYLVFFSCFVLSYL